MMIGIANAAHALKMQILARSSAGYALLLDSGEPKMASFVEELQRRLRVWPCIACRMPPAGLPLLRLSLHQAPRSHGFYAHAQLRLGLFVHKPVQGSISSPDVRAPQ